MGVILLYAHSGGSLLDWLLHLIAGGVVWHLAGELVRTHPLVAVGLAVIALVLLWARRRVRRAKA